MTCPAFTSRGKRAPSQHRTTLCCSSGGGPPLRLRCKLRKIRGERSLAEVADAAGINRANLSLIELGRMIPKDGLIPALEQAYGVEFEGWYSRRTLAVIEEDEAA